MKAGVPDDEEWFSEDDLLAFDHRTGIGVNMETLTAADSQIYGIRHLVLRQHVDRASRLRPTPKYQAAGVCLYAEVLVPADAAQDARQALTTPLPLGGEGRYVHREDCAASPNGQDPPEPGTDTVWVLATPGLFRVQGGDTGLGTRSTARLGGDGHGRGFAGTGGGVRLGRGTQRSQSHAFRGTGR